VKFNQKDKNGVASSGSYTAADETVRLRGGEPTVWDSRARTKATEIDSNTATDISFCARPKCRQLITARSRRMARRRFGKSKARFIF